jgi:hypothetical protein
LSKELDAAIEALTSLKDSGSTTTNEMLRVYSGLISSLESSLATIAENIDSGQSIKAMGQLTQAINALKVGGNTINVPKQEAPKVEVNSPVTVNVPEAPAPVIHLLRDNEPVQWVVSVSKRNFQGIEEMTITKQQPKRK